MTNFLLFLILVLLGLINYQLYAAFFVPELARRKAFKALSSEEMEELRKKITSEHYFKLGAEVKNPLATFLAKKVKKNSG